MIDFIYRLNDALPNWQAGMKRTLKQIAESTDTSLPHVLQYLSEGLGKDIDVAAAITLDEATEAILLLSKKLRPQIEEREREIAKQRELAIKSFYLIMERVQLLQVDKQWHKAFRSLCYFAGQYEERLSPQILIELCSEIIRTGIHSKLNIQELGQWLHKGVAVSLSFQTKEGIEEALDLLDAYSDYFLNEDSGKGPLVLSNILAALEEPAARFELWSEFKNLVSEIYKNPS